MEHRRAFTPPSLLLAATVLLALSACEVGSTSKKVVAGGAGDADAEVADDASDDTTSTVDAENDGSSAADLTIQDAGPDPTDIAVGQDTTQADTTATDTTATDTAATDTSIADTADDDTAADDTTPEDTTAEDAAIADTAVADTAVADTAVADTAVADTAVADTAVADTAVADTAVADTTPEDTASADTGAADTASADTASADTGAADTGPADAGGFDNSKCKGTAGPTGVNVGTYCIDSTEVTNAHYAAFLAAKGSDVTGQPAPLCDFNVAYAPQVWPVDASKDTLPVGGVDWCDAAAYCAWAGKRLCGKIGGGGIDLSVDQQVATTPANKADQSEWFNACSKGGTQTYPYGNSFSLTTCNGRGSDGSGNADGTDGKVLGLQPVGSYTGCVGGYPGLFDMAGNTHEWVDECKAQKGGNDYCATRGGNSYGSAQNTLCTWNYAYAFSQRKYQYLHIGFRCCADLKASGE